MRVKYIFGNLFLALLFMGLLFVSSANAQTTPTVDLQALIKQLQAQVLLLQKQIVELQTQLKSSQKEAAQTKEELKVTKEEVKATKEEVKVIKEELKLTRSLRRGESGEDVKKLQEFLKQFPEVYPEGLVTGFFGPRTEDAVKKLQEKYGIEALGFVGPKTLAKINELFAEGMEKSKAAPAYFLKVPGTHIATATQEIISTAVSVAATSVATTTPTVIAATTTTSITPAPAGPAAAPAVPAASPTPSPSTPPSAIVFEYAPTIRILSPTTGTTYTTSSSTIVLTASITDDKALATSTVFWRNLAILGTERNYTFTSVTGNIWETPPISLVPGVNNIVINAEDFQQPQPGVGAGGIYVTYNPPPPPPSLVISNLQASVTENSAVVSWNTDRPADSQVHYALSIPILVSSPTLVGPGEVTTSHSRSLVNLSSGTTYYYTVISKDSNGVTATSGDVIGIKSFTTLVPSTPPIGYWKFDGNGNNEIAGGPSAQIVGNAVFNASGGKYAGYAYIPTQSDWVKIPYNNMFDLPTSFTIEFWFRQRSDQSFLQDLVYKGTSGNNYNFRVFRQLWNQYNFGPIIVGYTAANTGYWSQTSNPNQLSHGSWHQVVYTRNANEAAYYLDGALTHSLNLTQYTEYSGPARTPANDIIIGDSAVDTDIDNLKIYNRSLNSSEIVSSFQTSKTTNVKDQLANIAVAIFRIAEEIKKLQRR